MDKIEMWKEILSREPERAEKIISRCAESVADRFRNDPFAALRAETHLRCAVVSPEDFLANPYGKELESESERIAA
jgi:hypothetical protein